MNPPAAGHNFDPLFEAGKIRNLFNAPPPVAVSAVESRPQRRRHSVTVDRDTFGRLVLEHLPVAQRFAIRLTGNADAGEEVVAEALLRAAKSWKSYRGEAKFKTWFFAIVINAFRDHCRRVTKGGEKLGDVEDLATASPLQLAEAQELGTAVAKMIGLLPPRQREILVLSVYEEQSSAEIASMLEISEQNVRTNLHLARERLKQLLAPFMAEKEL